MNARVHEVLTEKAMDLSPAQALDRVLRTASPAEIIEAALMLQWTRIFHANNGGPIGLEIALPRR